MLYSSSVDIVNRDIFTTIYFLIFFVNIGGEGIQRKFLKHKGRGYDTDDPRGYFDYSGCFDYSETLEDQLPSYHIFSHIILYILYGKQTIILFNMLY